MTGWVVAGVFIGLYVVWVLWLVRRERTSGSSSSSETNLSCSRGLGNDWGEAAWTARDIIDGKEG